MCCATGGSESSASMQGTERESDGSAILGGFLDGVNGDEFDVGHCQALGLQEQVAEILIATTSVDQHANVPVDRFDYAKANSGLAVVRDAVQMLQQRLRQFL